MCMKVWPIKYYTKKVLSKSQLFETYLKIIIITRSSLKKLQLYNFLWNIYFNVYLCAAAFFLGP